MRPNETITWLDLWRMDGFNPGNYSAVSQKKGPCWDPFFTDI